MERKGNMYIKGSVIVTDPCYAEYSGGNLTIDDMKQGNYLCFIQKGEQKGHQHMVKEMFIIEEDYYVQHEITNEDWLYYGEAMVDSGQMGIFDYDYFLANCHDDNYEDKNSWYRRICEMTIKETAGCMSEQCFVTSSGYGDGVYEVSVIQHKGRTFGIRVKFFNEES